MRAVAVGLILLAAVACSGTAGQGPPPANGQPVPSDSSAGAANRGAAAPGPPPGPRRDVIPVPESLIADPTWFTLTDATRIQTSPGSPEVARIGEQLAAMLRRPTGYPVPASPAAAGSAESPGAISLIVSPRGRLGPEGYQLQVAARGVVLRANTPAGLYRGVQTLRQLLPAGVEAATKGPGPWRIPGIRVVDRPRFGWRGAALDVARHFFSVAEVERYIDLLALYKINVLHLHLTDDQGWRLEIRRWPKLATHGGSTEVGGGPGGHYSRQDYARIVRYAQDRHITVVPEVDMPGHIGAALSAYPELSCDGRARPRHTGRDGAEGALCVGKPVVDRFVGDVIAEVAALTPGRYVHIGGDEVSGITAAQYAGFVERVQRVVAAHGKHAIGWQEIADARLQAGTVAQYWNSRSSPAAVRAAAGKGTRLVLSPASKVYLDMKYDPATKLGLRWAGYVDIRDAYGWDPARLLPGVGQRDVLGVEAQLWTETITDIDDAEFMAFPRLPAIAEVGWSPAVTRRWADFRVRLAGQGARLAAMDVQYYRSTQIPWEQKTAPRR